MKISYGIPNKLTGKRIVTIGNFDGVHKGHQSLLKFCCAIALKDQITSAVVTFKPHPTVFFKNKSNGCIQTLRDKAIEIKNAGVNELIILPFKENLANFSAENFIKKLLVSHLGMQIIVVGKDFKFGKKRSGNVKTLQHIGNQLNFKTIVTDDIFHRNEKISSSQIRVLAKNGGLEKVKELRGKPLTLSGHVLHGKKIGRTLGYPTLNILMPDDLCIKGIFAVTVYGLNIKTTQNNMPGIASLGRRPTVESNGRLILEVYVLDWDAIAYGQIVSVKIHGKIREEIKFDNLDMLRTQMQLDEINTRKFFKLDET